MHRRPLLAAAGALVAPLPGCLGTGIDRDDDGPRSGTPTDEGAAFEIGFAEQEGDSSNAGRERVLLTNVSDADRYLGGYTLTDSSGYEHSITGGLSLGPQARVAIVSQGVGDSVTDTDPPTYYRDAAHPELVLEDGEETVRLRDGADEVVVEATYGRN